jgi:hypothetical protein
VVIFLSLRFYENLVADGSAINNGAATDNSRLIYNIEFTCGGNYINKIRIRNEIYFKISLTLLLIFSLDC